LVDERVVMKVICDIYKSVKEQDMYLYVAKSDGLKRVPEALLERFGKPKHTITIVLQPGRRLARTTAEKMVAELEEKGFYLQLPERKDDYMSEIHAKNTKM